MQRYTLTVFVASFLLRFREQEAEWEPVDCLPGRLIMYLTGTRYKILACCLAGNKGMSKVYPVLRKIKTAFAHYRIEYNVLRTGNI